MRPELISFDAAGTLVDVHWQPGRFAAECAEAVGVTLDIQVAIESYDRMLGSRWRHYCSLHIPKDEAVLDGFWAELTADWLLAMGIDDRSQDVLDVAHERLYGPDQRAFLLYPDVVQVLELLRGRGFRMIVLSNWDYSIHRVLRNLGISDYFEDVIASLEHGPEKPEPALFEIVCTRVSLPPALIVHVGDNPVDDFEGARRFGMGALFLDRHQPAPEFPTLNTLSRLPAALEWLS